MSTGLQLRQRFKKKQKRKRKNILATLKAYIIEAPQWYTETDGLTQCFDANIPSELYAKIQEEAQKWLSSIKQEGEKAKKSIVSE